MHDAGQASELRQQEERGCVHCGAARNRHTGDGWCIDSTANGAPRRFQRGKWATATQLLADELEAVEVARREADERGCPVHVIEVVGVQTVNPAAAMPTSPPEGA